MLIIKNTNQIGKEIRLSRLLDERSQRALVVAYAHGIMSGPLPGMSTNEEIARVSTSLRGADGILMPMGFLPACQSLFMGKDSPVMFALYDWMNASRGSDLLGYDQASTEAVTSIERVLASGASGVMTYLYIGFDDPERESREMRRNAMVNELCQKYGLLHMIEPRVVRCKEKDEQGVNKLELMKLHVRMSAELGADLVKTVWPGSAENLKVLQDLSPAPILLAGGSKSAAETADAMAQAAVDAGTAGIVFGRNIYQADDPAAALERLKAIVHQA